MQQEIFNTIKRALTELGVGDVDFVVERPADMSHGDYATNAVLVAAKKLGKNPKEFAENLKEKLEGKVEGVKKVEIAGPGFINFFLSREAIVKEVEKAATDDSWGKNNLYEGKQVMVEYTSPNLFKPLHIGNLISTVLGESIARLYTMAGANVKRINYPSDIGPTIAKGVWGLQKLNLDPSDISQLGRAYVAGNDAFENSESAKKEIEEINIALYEDSNPNWTKLRKKGIETSLKVLNELCDTLGTKFDKEFFESEVAPLGKQTVLDHMKDGIFQESDGAVVYKGEQDGLHTRVFLNSHSLPTYEAKDLGLFELKRKTYPDFDITITDTGAEQTDYFKVLYAVIRRLHPDVAQKTLLHSTHGMLKLTTGKMSSRKGNIITGESLLADLQSASMEKIGERKLQNPSKVAQQVAVGAIKYAVLKQGSGKDIIFDPEKSLSLEGDSGPYLQYARVRASSVMRKVEAEGLLAKGEAWPSGLERPESAAFRLERTLVHFPEIIAHAAEELEPHYITTYLTELAATFNSFYAAEKMIVEGQISKQHADLVRAFERTMQAGLTTLGIPAPEEM